MVNQDWRVSLDVTEEMAVYSQKLARAVGLEANVLVNPSPVIIGDQLETHILEIDFGSVEGLRSYAAADDEVARGRLKI